jgi:hypothetical protein
MFRASDLKPDVSGNPSSPRPQALILNKPHLSELVGHLRGLKDRSACLLTAVLRGLRDRKRYPWLLKRHRAAIKMQKVARGFLARLPLELEEQDRGSKPRISEAEATQD